MAFDYVDLETAKRTQSLRMAVVRNVPSPWGESAKGILHVKAVNWHAVSHVPGNPELSDWTGRDKAPVLVTKDGVRKSGWAEILLYAEAVAPTPSLIPADPQERMVMFGLAHELMGEGGLCWCRRLQFVHRGMQLDGKPRRQAEYIGPKYGYDQDSTASVTARVMSLLGMFASILEARAGTTYFLGSSLTAVDIYSAATMAMFVPLPEDVCAMDPTVRTGFEFVDPETQRALPIQLLKHRDMMYEHHLELPLKL